MRQADREFASHALKHYVETILGPPNRPTYIADHAGMSTLDSVTFAFRTL
eukprot:SAG31_NODE_37453_length_304_cov_0.756098_1_plen_49_part_01